MARTPYTLSLSSGFSHLPVREGTDQRDSVSKVRGIRFSMNTPGGIRFSMYERGGIQFLMYERSDSNFAAIPTREILVEN